MPSIVTARYKCKQIELYTICRIGWTNFLVYTSMFTAISLVYTTLYGNARLADVDTAQALPDLQARNGIVETMRNSLNDVNNDALQAFKQLKYYITVAFAPVDYQAQWDAAGFSYYPLSGNQDWDATEQMLSSMVNYITLNSVVLLAGSNMPAGFTASVTTLQTTFSTDHLAFEVYRDAVLVDTEAKITANNTIYEDLIAMFGVARLTPMSAATLKGFTFGDLLVLISGGGLAGLVGSVTDDATGNPIASTQVSIDSIGYETLTATDGTYSLASIPAGTYDVTFTPPISAPGGPFIPQTISITLSTGVTSTLDVSMLT